MKKNSSISNECLLVSECLKKEKGHYFFRFYGAYKGNLVKRVKVKSELELKIKEAYVLNLEVIGVKEFVLYGIAKDAKILEDYTWL